MKAISAGLFHAPMCEADAMAAGRFSASIHSPMNTVSNSAPARSSRGTSSIAPPMASNAPARYASCVRMPMPAGTGCHCMAKSWKQMPTAPNKMAPAA